MNMLDLQFLDQSPAGAPSAEDALDLRRIQDFLKRRWTTIVAVTFMTMAATLVGLLTVKPLYTATAQILLDPAGHKAFGESILPEFSLETANIDSQISVLRSVTLLRHVVAAADLTRDPEFGRPHKPNILSRMINFLRGPDLGGAAPGVADGADKIPPEELIAIGNLSEALDVRRFNHTYVLIVSVTAATPDRAVRVANAIANVYISDQLAARYEGARKASAWLSERLEAISQQVRASDQAVSDFRRKHNLISASSDGKLTIGEQQLAEMNAKLAELHTETAEARAKYNQAAAIMKEGGDPDTIPDVVSSTLITQLRSQEADVARREADLRARYSGGNPEVVKVVAERGAIRLSIGREIKRIVTDLKNDFDIAAAREASLRLSIQKAAAANGLDDSVGLRLHELERINAANKAMYDDFLTRSRIAQEQSNFEQPEARVISPAVDPVVPSFPKKTSSEVLAMIVGALLGIGAGVARDMLEKGFLTPGEIEDKLGLPVLGAAPALKARERVIGGKALEPAAYGVQKPSSRYAEALRAVRVGLRMVDLDNPPKVILVTSTIPREGKTTAALSLAFSAQRAGLKVALVDADLRHPVVTRFFQLADRPGLADFLLGKASEDEIAHDIDGVTVIPAGTKTTASPDLLGSERMRRYLAGLRENFDCVFLDSAPVAPVIDAKVLAQLVEKIVYVVRWRTTQREIVAHCVDAIRGDGKIAGVLLNRIEESKAPQSGRYAHFSSKGYHNYYES
ncbi:polysaccharide biosynthesis tyrosine autokinase [Rhodoblastus acidophilus]|uniref:Polysaccharide biosynthesis tyrosine autokinase n=1 Tax=Candidatus Rhodoblastus alkanivorans TaxID=2954117 RepID=A0ABS9Z6S0_9HYPH|nr:polysaccharide biosynthesis tyrosine autokinase [Candidatus Rhodoblastus alkanivorans]MCI4679541.1 polysaccharide biosynthesis tyrosine autokinase [Candidatus Rhodoblastus alkanivorans]MCI4683292.1 polysaccharide biosynthesis tyrosine autokinase [Candidatus Rhodoblastus alkanivorans]MDI4640605.1 polysaccharide biosynthesis tyrosine autokinase [Rhodoblastus acidophilus]